MKVLLLLPVLVLALLPTTAVRGASPDRTSIKGELAGYRLAGVEPDGDPLYQTVMSTRLLHAAGLGGVHLIVNAYLENFKPDTTPILPDLLHPKQQAHNLGGFLQGKALLTDDAGNVISIGSFVAEAFLDNSNSAIMTLYSGKGGYGAAGRLRGRFTLSQVSKSTVTVNGSFTGRLTFSPAALKGVRSHAGEHMKPIEKIIRQVTVTPHAMVGRATAKSRSVPLRTGFNRNGSQTTTTPGGTSTASSGRHLSTLTMVAALGALASFGLAAILFVTGRRKGAT